MNYLQRGGEYIQSLSWVVPPPKTALPGWAALQMLIFHCSPSLFLIFNDRLKQADWNQWQVVCAESCGVFPFKNNNNKKDDTWAKPPLIKKDNSCFYGGRTWFLTQYVVDSECSNLVFSYLKDLDSIFSSFVKLQEDPNKTLDSSAEHVWTFKCEHILSDLNLCSLD